MQNYPFNFETLFQFANSNPYSQFDEDEKSLLARLEELRVQLHFPAVHNDVGNLISFLTQLKRPKVIFEMGSGYGHSCFWYMLGGHKFIEQIYLTEKREDLQIHFQQLPWPKEFKEKLNYYQGDAFKKLSELSQIDFLLIDGVKADYLKFLQDSYDCLSDEAIILIDNSYWRGSFLDKEMLEKQSAKQIKDLHEFLAQSKEFQSLFIPYQDGVTLIRKLIA